MNRFRIRVGSSFANSGGTVHLVEQYTNHPNFRWITMDNNISIIRTAVTIVYIPNAVQPAPLVGPNFLIRDDAPVRVSGWGRHHVSISVHGILKFFKSLDRWK